MTATRKRPRGLRTRRGRVRGGPFRAVYLQRDPDKRNCARAQRAGDGTLPWSRIELIRMDRAFCEAMRREIARGTEQAREPSAKPPARRLIRQVHPAPRRSGSSSPAALCVDNSDRDRM